jgi:hypothetical protein
VDRNFGPPPDDNSIYARTWRANKALPPKVKRRRLEFLENSYAKEASYRALFDEPNDRSPTTLDND